MRINASSPLNVLAPSVAPLLTGERLLDLVFTQAPGTLARLEQGANLLFANCCRGTALIELARQFPRSCFFGLAACASELAVAREAARAGWLQNLWLEPATGHPPYLKGSFHFALRQAHPPGITLADLSALLREGGLLFDLQPEFPVRESYETEALTVLHQIRQPDGWCTIARN